MFGCDYNGWVDLPEAEREGIEAFEFEQQHPAYPRAAPVRLRPLPAGIVPLPEQRAA
jgi:hypothetical protein